MPTFLLTDVASDRWVESFAITAADLGRAASSSWSITKHALRGGRRDGVDLIKVDNGALSFSVIPTRGMGIWKGDYRGDPLGWLSPVRDGPVHPRFVSALDHGGIGWLQGFDELLVRCGLENNGAPYEVKSQKPDGSESHTTFGLHGKIANIPASYVAVTVETEPEESLVIEGHVDESSLFGTQIRMSTTIRTAPGSNSVRIHDRFDNLGDVPCPFQVLYHWNFGMPYLEPGARWLAALKTVVPRDARAQEGLEHYDTYGPPTPGFAEQVYFCELIGTGDQGQTLVLLRNATGDKGVVLRFTTQQLPAFTLWNNTGGLRSGYVTGLEPATNYPNPRPFEQARHRVVTLPVNGRHEAETVLEVLNTEAAVADAEREIQQLQGSHRPTIHPRPIEPFAPEG